ncbi:MAG: DNA polymerase III subunit delta [Clostridiales bacterium]|nr:DNA polymerase III subunit delta [Clostridiales bacterium]
MKQLKEQLRNGEFSRFILLYGTEEYLKRYYRNKLKEALLSGQDDMNFSHYCGKGIDVKEVAAMSDTLPFFSDRRVILMEDTGFFKNQSELAEYLEHAPDTTFFLFVEKEVDKRNKCYKYVSKNGLAAELGEMNLEELKKWVAAKLKQNGKKMTEQNIRYFLEHSGESLDGISNELDKLVAYVGDREVVEKSDLDAVCVPVITGKLFPMIDAIAGGKQEQALVLYDDLLKLREKPLSILFLVTRHFGILIQALDFKDSPFSNSEIAKKLGVPPFAVRKYMEQAGRFTQAKLKQALELCLCTEQDIKTGQLSEQVGLELLLVTLSR